MVEKIIKYYEEIVMQHKWNKISWTVSLIMLAISIISVIYEEVIGIGTLIFELVLVILLTLISFLLVSRTFEEIIDKYKLNISKKKLTTYLGKNFREAFWKKKKQLLKRKIKQEKIDRDGQKVLIEALYNRYNELYSPKNVLFSIFSFIAAAFLVLVTIKNDSGKLIIEGLEIYMAILMIGGGVLYMWNILLDRLLLHTFDKKENLKALIIIIEEIYMVKDK